jgi:hypothetical protein
MISMHKMITKTGLKTWMLGESSLNKFERCIVFCHIAFIGVFRLYCMVRLESTLVIVFFLEYFRQGRFYETEYRFTPNSYFT